MNEQVECRGCKKPITKKWYDWQDKYEYNWYCDTCLQKEYDKNQDTWWLHELARRGLIICDKCNGSKSMYYGPWCPRCEPPEPKDIKSINLIQALNHLEAHHTGIKERIKNYLIEMDYIRNDTYVEIHLPKGKEDKEEFKDNYEDLLKLNELTKGEKNIIWEITW